MVLLRLAVVALGGVLFVGCSSSENSEGDCPKYTVVVDEGATGFSQVGEWQTDETCSEYCKVGYPVCQLVDATHVKCQMGCG
jgi:hypothetical protein